MCATCGCGQENHFHEHDHPAHAHSHEHAHDHPHTHPHAPGEGSRAGGRIVSLERDILEKNALLAARNRGWFEGRGILALNLMSAPGAGKTTLLARTLRELETPVAVIEGDQATELDADRLRQGGAKVAQINTGPGCHLDAEMVARGLKELAPPPGSIVLIENVGNLICPALFDLGERVRVVLFSVTEGEDKPLKYPHMFRAADLLILNKIDLLPHLDFDIDRAEENARRVNPEIRVLRLSAARGTGFGAWREWLLARLAETAPEGA